MSTSNKLWCGFVLMVLVFMFAFPTIGSRVGILTQEADGDPASTYTYSIKFPDGTYSIANNVGTFSLAAYLTAAAIGTPYDTEDEFDTLFAAKEDALTTLANLNTALSGTDIVDSGGSYTFSGYNSHLLWRLTPATGALGSPEAGDLIQTDGTYNPSGSELAVEEVDFFDGTDYFLWWDIAGNRYFSELTKIPYAAMDQVIATSGTLTPANMRGHVHVATDTGSWTITDTIATGDNFTLKARGAVVPTLVPNSSDEIYNNGTSCGTDKDLIGDGSAGDMIVCQYSAANVIDCDGYGFTCEE